MQVVASSFEIVAGGGAARRYTALALRTISCQFRSLRDAIKKQIQAVQQSLGEQSNSTNGQGLSRLRFVDQQVRQQRNLQQFGVLRQPWRPQRGLPETAVSVLRAWLFEHFLHPYVFLIFIVFFFLIFSLCIYIITAKLLSFLVSVILKILRK